MVYIYLYKQKTLKNAILTVAWLNKDIVDCHKLLLIQQCLDVADWNKINCDYTKLEDVLQKWKARMHNTKSTVKQ